MSVLSDKWIKKMALEEKMIDPVDLGSFQDTSGLFRRVLEMFLNPFELPELTKNIKQMTILKNWWKTQKMVKKMMRYEGTNPGSNTLSLFKRISTVLRFF